MRVVLGKENERERASFLMIHDTWFTMSWGYLGGVIGVSWGCLRSVMGGNMGDFVGVRGVF